MWFKELEPDQPSVAKPEPAPIEHPNPLEERERQLSALLGLCTPVDKTKNQRVI